MLLLQALLLLLLSISSMAIPVPGTATGLEPLPDKQKFPFFSVRDGNDEQAQKRDMFRFRGLWHRTAVIGEKNVIIVVYQDPHIEALRMIHPEVVEEVDFKAVFSDDHWSFVSTAEFETLEKKGILKADVRRHVLEGDGAVRLDSEVQNNPIRIKRTGLNGAFLDVLSPPKMSGDFWRPRYALRLTQK